MRKLYWRPSKVGWQIHLLIAIIALIGITTVEVFKVKIKQPYYKEKIQAARIMKRGMEAIKDYRIKNIGSLDAEVDPAGSGMIGTLISPITSNTGFLEAKRTTMNPNWAAVFVDMFKRLGLKEGDLVAMGISGSFPAINLAAYSAVEALRLKPIIITSTSASTWGANIPQLTWLDMERILYENRVISFRSSAASLGGQEDRAVGMSKEGKELLKTTIEQNGIRFITIKNEQESIEARMSIYREQSEGNPISVYVNIGGGTVSVGAELGKRLYRPGINTRIPVGALDIDSVMTRFAKDGIPVIHMTYINKLSQKYGLPEEPVYMPNVGEGAIFEKMEYNLYLTAGLLALLIISLYAFIKLDIGFRIFGQKVRQKPSKHPEQMV